MFPINQELITRARSILHERKNIYWIIGGACSGKSTVCRAIAEQRDIAIYDMDAHIFGSYMALYCEARHPANKAWFSADNPLAWALSLAEEDFDALNRAANAEYLDLMADEFAQTNGLSPLLVDGGFTHPSIMAQVVSPANIFCLETTEADRVQTWETDEARAEMKEWICALPDPEKMWQKFLALDKMIAQTIATECRENNIRTFLRGEHTSVDELARTAAAHFGV